MKYIGGDNSYVVNSLTALSNVSRCTGFTTATKFTIDDSDPTLFRNENRTFDVTGSKVPCLYMNKCTQIHRIFFHEKGRLEQRAGLETSR
jgi:hypothetical protein